MKSGSQKAQKSLLPCPPEVASCFAAPCIWRAAAATSAAPRLLLALSCYPVTLQLVLVLLLVLVLVLVLLLLLVLSKLGLVSPEPSTA